MPTFFRWSPSSCGTLSQEFLAPLKPSLSLGKKTMVREYQEKTLVPKL